MPEHLLTINAGSSSLKFALFERPADCSVEGKALWLGQADGLAPGLNARLRVHSALGDGLCDTVLRAEQASHTGAMAALLAWQAEQTAAVRITAAGHRIVHGGMHFTQPLRITPDVLTDLATLVPLAPLHQPHNLAGVKAAMAAFVGVPQVACFDTAFHAAQPELNQRFALPAPLFEEGVRRYGFHGLSYESIVAQLHAAAPAVLAGRVVIAHLGNGASMCAVQAGQPVATTMGFSPLDGLTMGTRCGALDPAVVLYLMQTRGMTTEQVSTLLYRQSGLLGLSGLSSDMRELHASQAPGAALAIDHFVEQVVQQLGRLAAAMRGIDSLVFTGGIGENDSLMRQRVLQASAWLGVRPGSPQTHAVGQCLTQPDSRVSAWVVKTDEEAVIAHHTHRVLTQNHSSN